MFFGAVSLVGRALPWHGRGHRFESGTVHQNLIVAEMTSLTTHVERLSSLVILIGIPFTVVSIANN